MTSSKNVQHGADQTFVSSKNDRSRRGGVRGSGQLVLAVFALAFAASQRSAGAAKDVLSFSITKFLTLCVLSSAMAVAADELDRAITLFKDGEVVQAIGTLNTLTTSEDAAVFHADMVLRVFDRQDRAVEILEPWEGSERVDVRLAALRGASDADASKLNCDTCRYSDATVDPFYYQIRMTTPRFQDRAPA